MQASPLYPHYGVSSPLAAYKTFPPQYRDYNPSPTWSQGFQPPFDASTHLSTRVNSASNSCNQVNTSTTSFSTTSTNIINVTNNYSEDHCKYLDGLNVKSSGTQPLSLPTPPFPEHYNHTLPAGKTKNESGEKDITPWHEINNAAAAFLGPQLWEKPIPCKSDLKSDLKLEYMDLEEFLNENDIDEELLKQNLSERSTSLASGRETRPDSSSPEKYTQLAPSPVTSPSQQPFVSESTTRLKSVASPPSEAVLATDSVSSPVSSCNYPDSPRSSDSPLPSDDMLASVPGEDFDPRTRVFSEDELKPQPMIKKSRKQQYIPNELKDERYWARRRKNNVAAKRSRDARRTKENQIAMRASFLEKENQNLRTELDKALSLVETLKKRLVTFESG